MKERGGVLAWTRVPAAHHTSRSSTSVTRPLPLWLCTTHEHQRHSRPARHAGGGSRAPRAPDARDSPVSDRPSDWPAADPRCERASTLEPLVSPSPSPAAECPSASLPAERPPRAEERVREERRELSRARFRATPARGGGAGRVKHPRRQFLTSVLSREGRGRGGRARTAGSARPSPRARPGGPSTSAAGAAQAARAACAAGAGWRPVPSPCSCSDGPVAQTPRGEKGVRAGGAGQGAHVEWSAESTKRSLKRIRAGLSGS